MAAARFLVDEDLPRSLSSALQDAGFDAVDVRDVGLRGQPDDRIFEAAVREGRVLISGALAVIEPDRVRLRRPAGS